MSRLLRIVTSSIGKKEGMAVTGLLFTCFLVVHLAGNLTIFGGTDVFNAYAARLHSLGPLVLVFEIGLIAIGLLHVVLSSIVVVQNWKARGGRYAVKRAEGGRSIGSRTMAITGPVILLFVIFHVAQFTLVEKTAERPISTIVAERFHDPLWAAFYVVCVLLVGVHVSHGIWSALQTLGLALKRHGFVRDTSLVIGVIFALGFGLIPIIVYSMAGLLR